MPSRTEEEQREGRLKRAGSEEEARAMLRRQMSAAREPSRPVPGRARPPAPARVGPPPSLDRADSYREVGMDQPAFSRNEPVPHHAETPVSWNGNGKGLLSRLDEIEAAVRELALEEPRHFEAKLADFREALRRLVAVAESNEARLVRLEQLLG